MKHVIELQGRAPSEASGTCNGKPFVARFVHVGLKAFAGQGRWRASGDLTKGERQAIGKAIALKERKKQ